MKDVRINFIELTTYHNIYIIVYKQNIAFNCGSIKYSHIYHKFGFVNFYCLFNST